MNILRIILAAGLLLSSTACGIAAGQAGPTPILPAGLEQTRIDDQAILLGFEALDVALDLVDAAIATGVIVPGTPRALRIANGLDRARNALNAAASAQRAGQTGRIDVLMKEATAAMKSVRLAFTGSDEQ